MGLGRYRFEGSDYDDGEQPGQQDTPAGWKGPFGPPKKRGWSSCLPALLLIIGLFTAGWVFGVCGPVVYHVAAAALLVWPRRVLSGWSCSCGTYNHEMAGMCAGCGKGRS